MTANVTRDNSENSKRPWRTPRIERLLTQGASASPMPTMATTTNYNEGKFPAPTEAGGFTGGAS